MPESLGRQPLPLGGVASNNLWVDKSLFDKYGVSTEVKTYADLKAACDTFAAAKVQCFTMGTNSTDTFSTELLRTIANSFDPAYYLKALHGPVRRTRAGDAWEAGTRPSTPGVNLGMPRIGAPA